MGVLRLLLALSVVAGHIPPPFHLLHFVGGKVAVQIFFVISGFYMQMVLSERRYSTLRAFYMSRFLRIFPTYWIVAAISLLYIHRQFAAELSHLATGPAILVGFSNAALFFQDATLFLSADNRSVWFSTDIPNDVYHLHIYLLMPPSWSLALELYFYLAAPTLAARSSLALLALATASLAVRLICYSAGLDHDPWSYRFFPFELLCFLSGMLSYRLYHFLKKRELNVKTTALVVATGLVTFLFSNAWMEEIPSRAQFLVAVAIVPLLPFVFHLSRNSVLDRLIGEISYPVYLVHLLSISLVVPILRNRLPSLSAVPDYFIVVAVTIAASYAIWFIVDRPIDLLRHKLGSFGRR